MTDSYMHVFLHHLDWAVAMRTEWLTPVFKVLTLLGYSSFVVLFITLGFWTIDKQIFARTGLVVILSALLNSYLKLVFQDPRPDAMYWLDPKVGHSYGFPSGHAQIAVVLWMWVAWEVRKKWVWGVCGIIVAGICFSRLYLGVHDVEDVLGGALIGGLILTIFSIVLSPRFIRFIHLNAAGQVLVLVIFTVLMLLIWPGSNAKIVMVYGGFLIGLWAGVGIERRTIGYQAPVTLRSKAVIAVLGAACFYLLKKGLHIVAPAHEANHLMLVFIQSMILGLYATFFAPWMFVKLKLSSHIER